MPRNAASTRDRILAAAAALYYEQGIHAVSVDAVAERAGVTKRTLYYHFRSKGDLVAAYLAGRDQPNLAAFCRWFAATDGDVADKLRGVFSKLARAARSPKWRGCGFLRTAAELANLPGHPAMHAARTHKENVETWLRGVLEDEQIPGAAALARQIRLLLDGAFAVVLLHRDASYMETAGDAAWLLVRSATAGR
jgi:AcrR family transcriptional regulator